MTHRERFFAILEGHTPDRPAFFPDITSWYMARRTPEGAIQTYPPGAFIPDSDPLHKQPGDMPSRFSEFTFLDFYKEFDWGLPVHIYDWYDVEYDGVDKHVTTEGDKQVTRLTCRKGELVEVKHLATGGSWAKTKYFVETLDDLEVMKYIVSHTRYRPRNDRIRDLLDAVGDQGVCDLVLSRSPFGKLVHEYLGFEKVIYAMHDEIGRIKDFLALQEQYDLELVAMAANTQARIVIISDHADENLIAPAFFRDYCIPYYRKANAILHEANKIVSTHLDGNFKGFFPYLSDTDFDLLDGCTPAPMSNYEVEELASALPDHMSCYCGVPSTLFCQDIEAKTIVAFGERILDAFSGRVILNIGDILPTQGDILNTIDLGKMANSYLM